MMSTSCSRVTKDDPMADLPPPSYSFAEAVATAGAVATAAAVGIMKLFERFRNTQKSSSMVGAEIDVIEGLRKALSRLSEQNGSLATSLNELQTEVIALRRENAELHLTVRSLNQQIALMREGPKGPQG
jgi:cell division protein FtsB